MVNHSLDTKAGDETLSNHDDLTVPCLKTDKLMKLEDELNKYDVILINEAQFFDDLYDLVNRLLFRNKTIYIGGLDGDYERKKFGQILDLIPLCDKVTKLTSLCAICKNGKQGLFSLRMAKNIQKQILIDETQYMPVCRSCYDLYNL